MRQLFVFISLIWGTGAVFAQNIPAEKPVIKVAVLAYDGMELQDFAGPADVFIKAGSVTRGQYQVYTVAFKPGMVFTDGHIGIQPDYQISNMPKPDVLVIPGAGMKVIDSLREDSAMCSFIRQYKDSVAVTMSVCTGAYLLGAAGILDHHKATTHFFVADDFGETFPNLTLVKEVRYVDEGNIITTSGVTSGIDGALHLVERYSGDRMSSMVARGMQYYPHREEAWPLPGAGMKFQRDAHPMNMNNLDTSASDVVCRMPMVDKKINTEYKGKTYYFCSETCKKNFLKNPGKYIK
ncbi:DJ-1/PfpI family protein [Chitinophaga sancti]|uniref:DJ-1/PfpI family protein n=1 Tax=Chitinophaga sancti TaxID=1004 RepID=UPI002A747E50|nr:DJ-1/PfpI family protein [Chitinophaga sancti]WPQ60666.1 DJ-1/PfpI family protein [Chitinophaga sancti]